MHRSTVASMDILLKRGRPRLQGVGAATHLRARVYLSADAHRRRRGRERPRGIRRGHAAREQGAGVPTA